MSKIKRKPKSQFEKYSKVMKKILEERVKNNRKSKN